MCDMSGIFAGLLAGLTEAPAVEHEPLTVRCVDVGGRITAVLYGHCPDCRDSGWGFGSDDLGRTYTTPCSACGHLRVQAERLTSAEIPAGPFLAATIDATDWTHYQVPGMARAAKGWVSGFRPGCGSLCFSGANQRGKTHLLAAMARAIALRGYVVRWVRVPQLLEMERTESVARRTFLRSGRVDLLVLDELGGADSGRLDWMRGVYEETLGARLEAGLACLVSTNLRPHAAAGEPLALVDCVGERVTSRLRRYARSVELSGPEYAG